MVAVLRGEMRGWKRKGPSLNPLCVSRWPKEVFLPLSSMKSGDERGAAALSDRKTRVRTREMYLIALYQRRWPRRVYRDRAALSFHEGWPVLLPCPLRFTIIIEVYPILRTCWTIANGIRDKGFRNDFVINRNFFRPSARRCCVFLVDLSLIFFRYFISPRFELQNIEYSEKSLFKEDKSTNECKNWKVELPLKSSSASFQIYAGKYFGSRDIHQFNWPLLLFRRRWTINRGWIANEAAALGVVRLPLYIMHIPSTVNQFRVYIRP